MLLVECTIVLAVCVGWCVSMNGSKRWRFGDREQNDHAPEKHQHKRRSCTALSPRSVNRQLLARSLIFARGVIESADKSWRMLSSAAYRPQAYRRKRQGRVGAFVLTIGDVYTLHVFSDSTSAFKCEVLLYCAPVSNKNLRGKKLNSKHPLLRAPKFQAFPASEKMGPISH